MKIKIWGVRGSIPCPGLETVYFGGNTACLELRFEDLDRFIIIDAGSGIRTLGNWIMKNELPKGPINTQIFITHTHWDHIMGFPFFVPIYVPGTKLTIYGPVTYEDDGLDKIIGGQLSYRYFPVRQSELAADINYVPMKERSMDLGDGIWVTSKYLNHPILCLGYRFEYKGKVFCTAYDTEPFRNVFPSDPDSPDYDEAAFEEGERAAKEENEKIMGFLQGADLLIHDSQYTREEYKKDKMGWGHSHFEWVINTAHRAKVKKVLFFHHDPLRTDEQLTELIEKYERLVKGKTTMQIAIAREGEELDI
ncbi:MAG: MBL fold metallo-hydrolase [Spirochaetales bacterium]|nr:MAG: MBL fold metallo-hydrolase [Spirochaetales bacterium]